MDTETEKELIGANIKKLYVNKVEFKGYTLFDLNQLVLETDKGNFVFDIEGDCCSTGYIDHIGLNSWPNEHGVIEKVEDIIMPKIELANTAQDDDEIYGTKIITSKGTIFLEYRNSSNGYYGSYYTVRKIDNIENDKYTLLKKSF